MTETANIAGFWALGWEVRSFDFPVVKVDPPGKVIDALTHCALLEDSLERYKDIWFVLARC